MDIVEKLREHGHDPLGANWLLDAADEIERLRRSLMIEKQWRKGASDDADRYRFLRSHPEWMGWKHDFRGDEIDRQVDEQMAKAHNDEVHRKDAAGGSTENMMDLKEKIETNTWDSIDYFMKVMDEAMLKTPNAVGKPTPD